MKRLVFLIPVLVALPARESLGNVIATNASCPSGSCFYVQPVYSNYGNGVIYGFGGFKYWWQVGSSGCADGLTVNFPSSLSPGQPLLGVQQMGDTTYTPVPAGGSGANQLYDLCAHAFKSNCIPLLQNNAWDVKNANPYSVIYQAYRGTSPLCGAYTVVDPNLVGHVAASVSYSSCDPPPSDVHLMVVQFGNGVQLNSDGTGCKWWTGPQTQETYQQPQTTITAANNNTGSGSGNTTGSGATSTNSNAGNFTMPSTNTVGPLSTNGIADGTLDADLKSLYSMSANGFAGANDRLDLLDKDLNTGNQNLQGAVNGLTNWLGRGGGTNLFIATNDFTDAGITNAINSEHRDLTNLLGQLLATNTMGLSGVGTNLDSANAIANGVLNGGFNSTLDNAVSDFGTAPALPGGAGSPVAINLGGGFVIQGDPFTGQWGSVWQMFYQVAKWFLVTAYLTKIAIDSYKFVELMGSAKQLSIPNLQGSLLGFGGNFGAALAPVLLVALMAVYGVLLGVASAQIGGWLQWHSVFSTNPFASAGGAAANGVAYLLEAFPFDVLMSLTGAYIVWRFTLTKAGALAALAVRALVGGG